MVETVAAFSNTPVSKGQFDDLEENFWKSAGLMLVGIITGHP
jgi:hypothetical protein